MKKTTPLILIAILFSVVITSNGEKKCPMKAAFAKSMEACKDKISEDNAKLLKDDEFTDNEEIRMFKTCIMIHSGILEDKKISVEKIQGMIKDYVAEEELDAIMNVIKICKGEAEVGLDDSEVATLFISCFKKAINEESDSKE